MPRVAKQAPALDRSGRVSANEQRLKNDAAAIREAAVGIVDELQGLGQSVSANNSRPCGPLLLRCGLVGCRLQATGVKREMLRWLLGCSDLALLLLSSVALYVFD